MKRVMKRVEVGDAEAIYSLGYRYANGLYGLPQNWDKAFELWHRAAELGNAFAYHNIGIAYFDGTGVGRDQKKATHYFEQAAMRGDHYARHNLGLSEADKGNYGRALKHFMIAAEGGSNESLMIIQDMYMNGDATKVDYANSLRAYQAHLVEVKSNDRDKAAAHSGNYNYYE
jgi:TPR repeat protein